MTKHILSDALWTFRRVGHGVGQANSLPEKSEQIKEKTGENLTIFTGFWS